MPALLHLLGSLSWLDWCLVIVLLLSVIRALLHGLLRELFWLAGAILGLALATVFYDLPAPLLQRLIRSRHIDDVLGFLLILFAVMLLAALLGRTAHGAASLLGLGWLDSIAGGLFGLLRGWLTLTAFFMALIAFVPRAPFLAQTVQGSQIARSLLSTAHIVTVILPGHMEQRLSDGLTAIRNTP
jgi:membrane protein required for colicin V production